MLRLTMTAAACGALLAGGSAAGASASPVREGLSAVSCPKSSWCMAVGSYVDARQTRHALAMAWDGHSWHQAGRPPGGVLRSVSCSSASFCLARGSVQVGRTGLTDRWDGQQWRSMPSPSFAATGPSCASRSLCMLLTYKHQGQFPAGADWVVQSWNGRVWRMQPKSTVCGHGPPAGSCTLEGVSCGTVTACLAVGWATADGNGDAVPAASTWLKNTWTFQSPPAMPSADFFGTAGSVSCAGTFCMTLGFTFGDTNVPDAVTWNARTDTWADVSPFLNSSVCTTAACSWTSAVACGSASDCMAFTSQSGLLNWNGTSWEPAPPAPAGRGARLAAISCHQSFCMAVGSHAAKGGPAILTETWNGTAWQVSSS